MTDPQRPEPPVELPPLDDSLWYDVTVTSVDESTKTILGDLENGKSIFIHTRTMKSPHTCSTRLPIGTKLVCRLEYGTGTKASFRAIETRNMDDVPRTEKGTITNWVGETHGTVVMDCGCPLFAFVGKGASFRNFKIGDAVTVSVIRDPRGKSLSGGY